MSSNNLQKNPLVAVVMGSDSDLSTLQPAIKILEKFNIKTEVRILSAHRTPLEMIDFAKKAKSKGLQIIIAGAGGAAHLPGMLASITPLPVIGVPIMSKALSGIDSMHSILQMPAGIPVATVAIDGGLNAALLATQILSLSDPRIEKELLLFRENLHGKIIEKDNHLSQAGSTKYLSEMQ